MPRVNNPSVWETLQDHENFKADKDNFHRILSGFGPSIGSEGIKYIRDVVSDIQDPHIALSAPVTEIAYWTLKEGTDSKVFQEKVDKLVKLAISWGSAAGIHPGGWGRIADDDKVFCVLLGWDSLEVRQRDSMVYEMLFDDNIARQIFHKAIGASPEALVLIGELKELADLDLKHTIIKKH